MKVKSTGRLHVLIENDKIAKHTIVTDDHYLGEPVLASQLLKSPPLLILTENLQR